MAPIFIRSITLSGTWQKLAATRTVLRPAGVSATLIGVDLSRIEVKGTSPDSVLVAGGIARRVVNLPPPQGGGGGGSPPLGGSGPPGEG
jgi:hypothetical protein